MWSVGVWCVCVVGTAQHASFRGPCLGIVPSGQTLSTTPTQRRLHLCAHTYRAPNSLRSPVPTSAPSVWRQVAQAGCWISIVHPGAHLPDAGCDSSPSRPHPTPVPTLRPITTGHPRAPQGDGMVQSGGFAAAADPRTRALALFAPLVPQVARALAWFWTELAMPCYQTHADRRLLVVIQSGAPGAGKCPFVYDLPR